MQKHLKWLFVGIAVFLLAGSVTSPLLTVLATVSFAFMIFFSYHLDWGLYIMIGLAPMTGWKISLAQYPALFQEFPGIMSVNGPIIDFWIVFLLGAYLLFLLRKFWQEKRIRVRHFGLGWWSIFVFSALLSLMNLHPLEVGAGIKFITRFFLFLYIGYIWLGVNVCHSRKIFHHSLQTFAGVGVFAAVLGALSFFTGGWQLVGDFRAVPISLFGWAPFGYQHILLAEVLVTTVPAAAYMWYTAEHKSVKKFWYVGTLLMIIIGIATLSRTAWIAFFVQLMCVLVFFHPKSKDVGDVIVKHSWLAIPLAPLLIYGVIFLFSNPGVSSSTSSRWYMSDISWHLFLEHPWVGQGAGSFVSRLSDVALFRLEFGDPLENHGFLQKIGSEQGIFGLVSFFLFLWWVVKRLIGEYLHPRGHKEAKAVLYFGIFTVIGVLIFQLFSTQYYAAITWIPIMLVLAGVRLYTKSSWYKKGFLEEDILYL